MVGVAASGCGWLVGDDGAMGGWGWLEGYKMDDQTLYGPLAARCTSIDAFVLLRWRVYMSPIVPTTPML